MLFHNIARLLFFIFLFFYSLASASSTDIKKNFLVISDIHLDLNTLHKMDIHPADINEQNDLDRMTFDKLLSGIINYISLGIIAKPQFIIILGDINGHSRVAADSPMKNESVVFGLMKQYFPNTPIFYTYGNNDSLIVKYGPFTYPDTPNKHIPVKTPYEIAINHGKWSNGFLSSQTLCKNKKIVFPCIITENSEYGFYAAYIQPKFRLISLNSVLFSPRRRYTTELEAMNHLQWLEEQLVTAEKQNESVLITMHVPPGNNLYDHSQFWLPKEQNKFLKLVKKFNKTIIGMLAAHTHMEELKIIKDEDKIISGIYLTAALSTSEGNSPSFKTFYFSEQDSEWQLANYETFYVKAVNSNVNRAPLMIYQLYDYQHYYCNNGKKLNLLACLNHLTLEKMQAYYTAGNSKFNNIINFPDDVNIRSLKIE